MRTRVVLRWTVVWGLNLAPAAMSAPADAAGPESFVNPIAEGADPWVVRDPNRPRYLWCLSAGNRGITIHAGDRLSELGPGRLVWRAPESGPVSQQVWAPELHFLDGRWHVYFAASDGDNANHLTYILRSADEDPFGDYELHGPLATGDGADGRSPNQWSIDMTVLEHAGRRYAIWSGWDETGSDRQFLYAAPMASAVELAAPRVLLCGNDTYPWEYTEEDRRGRGLNEAPQVVQHEGRTFLLYSCGASWLPTYKLGILELTGDDPLDPAAWTKRDQPVFVSTPATYGVGHSCVVPSPDGSQWWHVYHAKRDRTPGWQRGIYIQPMMFDPAGFPVFDTPVPAGLTLTRPAGEAADSLPLPFADTLRNPLSPPNYAYYGHHQSLAHDQSGLHLGITPDEPVNHYRSGEKILLAGTPPPNLSAEVTIHFQGRADARDAGILFRASLPAVGYDAQHGYFAGLIPATGLIILGKTDGRSWSELARAPADPIDPTQPQTLRVTVQDDRIEVLHNNQARLTATDTTYRQGRIGLRVVDTHAVFSNFRIR